jgi:hypothetical protein
MASRSVIKTAKYAGEPVYVNGDGSVTPYISHEIVGHREMYGAHLHLIFKHTADFHMTMLEILSDKYNLSVDEMYDTVSKDPRFTEMVVNPTIHAMGYFENKDLEKKIPAPVEESVPALVPEEPVKKIVKLKKPSVKAPKPIEITEQPVTQDVEQSTPAPATTIKKVKKPQIQKLQ